MISSESNLGFKNMYKYIQSISIYCYYVDLGNIGMVQYVELD